jgi:hypothetical protein
VLKRIVVKVDRTAPEIELLGNNPSTQARWGAYEEPGVKLKDNYYTEAQLKPLLVTDMSKVDMTRPGLYFVSYTLTDPSGNTASKRQRLIEVVESTTGMDELNHNSNLSVYPNPGKGLFTISTKNSIRIASIKVMDLLGKEVYAQTLNNTQTQIDLTNMNKGLYMIILEDQDKKAYSGKIVIE